MNTRNVTSLLTVLNYHKKKITETFDFKDKI